MPAAKGQDVEVWQKVFQELIHEVRPWHRWTLTLDNSLIPNTLQPGWTQYQQQVFARFTCSWCSRNWASAQVQVLCHMHWSKRESMGQVKMRIFTQRCQKCSEPPFEVPEFTEENISRILNNLVFRILKKCYGEGFKSMETIPTIKDISLKGPHDTDNCEACLQGFCSQCELDLANPSPMSPSIPTISTPTFGVPIYKPSLTRNSTVVDAVGAGDSGVKKEGIVHNPWFPEPPQAKSPRANTNYPEQSIGRSSTVVDAVTGHDRVKKGGVVQSPCYPKPPHTKNPRANTNYPEQSIVEISSPREDLYSHSTQNRMRCNLRICCCLIIPVLIIVVVVVVIVKTTL